MPKRLKPEDLVAEFYLEEGFYEVGREEEAVSTASKLILTDGKRELVISILDEDALSSRGALHEVLLEAEKMREKFNGAVIAVPRNYLRAIDEEVLIRHGLGLLVYDRMGAEEIISPRIEEKKEERRTEAPPQIEIEELRRLRSEVSKILRILDEFEARLDRLEREQRTLATRINRLESEEIEKGGVEKIEEKVVEVASRRDSDRLPAFLRDNPWVEILSKRE